jgi:hypothetical protein
MYLGTEYLLPKGVIGRMGAQLFLDFYSPFMYGAAAGGLPFYESWATQRIPGW